MGKKGQVTIFVIIAILIVVAGILIYQFVPAVQNALGGIQTNPNVYIKDCIEDDFNDAIQTISLQGGEFEPESYFSLKGQKLNYLCYASEYFEYCKVQKAFLKESIEKDLSVKLKSKADSCFNSLKEDYESKNYQVSLQKGDVSVKILPDRSELTMDMQLSIKKKEEQKSFESFSVSKNNNLYQMLGVARSIIEMETTMGEAEPIDFMSLYRGLKVEKLKQGDETKLYIITDKKSGDKFQFASRSLAFPPGYI